MHIWEGIRRRMTETVIDINDENVEVRRPSQRVDTKGISLLWKFNVFSVGIFAYMYIISSSHMLSARDLSNHDHYNRLNEGLSDGFIYGTISTSFAAASTFFYFIRNRSAFEGKIYKATNFMHQASAVISTLFAAAGIVEINPADLEAAK